MTSVYANASCSPWTPRDEACNLGAYVAYAVNVTQAEDVILAIRFAQQYNIHFVVRNTGHEYGLPVRTSGLPPHPLLLDTPTC